MIEGLNTAAIDLNGYKHRFWWILPNNCVLSGAKKIKNILETCSSGSTFAEPSRISTSLNRFIKKRGETGSKKR